MRRGCPSGCNGRRRAARRARAARARATPRVRRGGRSPRGPPTPRVRPCRLSCPRPSRPRPSCPAWPRRPVPAVGRRFPFCRSAARCLASLRACARACASWARRWSAPGPRRPCARCARYVVRLVRGELEVEHGVHLGHVDAARGEVETGGARKSPRRTPPARGALHLVHPVQNAARHPARRRLVAHVRSLCPVQEHQRALGAVAWIALRRRSTLRRASPPRVVLGVGAAPRTRASARSHRRKR